MSTVNLSTCILFQGYPTPFQQKQNFNKKHEQNVMQILWLIFIVLSRQHNAVAMGAGEGR